MKKRYIVDKHGTETPIKGHKHRLRANGVLTQYPEELIASDEDDPEKISVLDAPHIREALVKDYANNQDKKKEKVPERKLPAPVGVVMPVSQYQIDFVRLRICKNLLNMHLAEAEAGRFNGFPPRHVWFPDDNVNKYELRDGNPPSDRDRPKHLRNLKIELDPVAVVNYDTFKEILKYEANEDAGMGA